MCAELAAAAVTAIELLASAAFVRKVVGLPWRKDAAGPDAFDCWGLAHVCQREVFGRELPLAAHDPADIMAVLKRIAAGDASVDWREVKQPRHGDVVTLRSASHPRHIGVWLALDQGKLLHAVENGGVMFQPRTALELLGWGRFQFYRSPS